MQRSSGTYSNEKSLRKAISLLAQRRLRDVPLRLLPSLGTLAWASHLVDVEWLARGREWNASRGLARRVDLLPGFPRRYRASCRSARPPVQGPPGLLVSVYQFAQVLRGQRTDFTGQPVAVLAHGDPQGKRAPYVVHYLSQLRQMGYRTVPVSASPLDLSRKESLVVDALLYRSCSGYDFTSGKAALQRMLSLRNAKELLLTNDSIFAPVGALSAVTAAMDSAPCDFWGMVESHEVQPPLQSYDLVFRRRVLPHEAFMRYWDAVTVSPQREDAIHYELTLSPWLALNGLAPGAFVPAAIQPFSQLNPTQHVWRQLIEMGVPLIKRDLLLTNREEVDIHDWKKVVTYHEYPIELIKEYLHRPDGRSSPPSSSNKCARAQAVSVIMPSYNYSRFLDQAIGSVIGQTWPHWELLVVDDGSDDGSVGLVRGYAARDPRVKLLQHPDKGNHGLAPSLELGIETARYETLAFLESDDTWRPDSLEVRLERMEISGAGMVFSNVELVSEEGADLSEKRRLLNYLNLRMKNRVPPFALGLDILGGNIVPTFSCVMIKKCLLRGFDSPVPPWLDWWLWAQIAFDKTFAYVQEPLTSWRVHSRSYNTTTKEHAALRKKFYRGLRNKLMPDALNRGDLRMLALLLFLRPLHLSYKLFKLLTNGDLTQVLLFMRQGLRKIKALDNE